MYNGKVFGKLKTDLLVNNLVIVAVSNFESVISEGTELVAKNQLLLTDKEVLLILNFGKEGTHKRLFLTNDFKKLDNSQS